MCYVETIMCYVGTIIVYVNTIVLLYWDDDVLMYWCVKERGHTYKIGERTWPEM